MQLFDLLRISIPGIQPSSCKIHLAVWNGQTNPFDVFLDGGFKEWQEWQGKANFNRELIVSLIQIPGASRWLFAGVFKSLGFERKAENHFAYKTEPLVEIEELVGRIVVNFKRPGRQSYLRAENWAHDLTVQEILPKKAGIRPFPGYGNVLVMKEELDRIVSHKDESWRTSLENVPGIYLIVDTKTGAQYVGSATSQKGIWQRWVEYSKTGHGGNKLIRKLLENKKPDYAKNFRFGLLEIGTFQNKEDVLLQRESFWKNLLRTRDCDNALNAN